MFKGIAKSIGALIGRDDLKPIDEALEKEIKTILKKGSEKTPIPREDNITWCNITRDDNPLHRDGEIAKAYESIDLEDIIIVGTLTSSVGERISGEVIKKIRDYLEVDEDELKITGQQTRFRGIVYPDRNILWQFPEQGYREKRGEIELKLTGSIKGNNVMSITTSLGKEKRRLPEIAGPIKSTRYNVTNQEIEEMTRCAGYDSFEKAPNMFPVAYVPPTLLRMQRELCGKVRGTNASMDFDFFRELKEGNIQVDIFTPERLPRKPVGGNYLYKFRAVTSQDTKPINYGEIMCATPEKIDFTKLSSPDDIETF